MEFGAQFYDRMPLLTPTYPLSPFKTSMHKEDTAVLFSYFAQSLQPSAMICDVIRRYGDDDISRSAY